MKRAYYPSGIKTEVEGPDGPFTVRSKLEARVCRDLICRRVPFSYESVSIQYKLMHKYNPDIILTSHDGARQILVEVKGYFLSSDRTKMLAVKKQNPYLDLRMVFQSANKTLSKKSSTTYGEWCAKHGIQFAEEFVPESWLKELEATPLQ